MLGAAGDRLVLKEDRSYVVSEPNGAIRSDSPDGQGMWMGDMRMLSDYRLRIDGVEPVVRATSLDAGSLGHDGTAAGFKVERYVDAGLHERITITNAGPAAAEARLELMLGADFVDMLALRGFAPDLASPPYASLEETRSGVLLKERNGSARATQVVITPAGTRHRIAVPGLPLPRAADGGQETATPDGPSGRAAEPIQQGLLDSR